MNPELARLNRRFEDHLDDYREHVSDDLVKHARQDEMHEQNMEAISALTKSTQGVVDGWVFANNVQRFIKWLSGFAVFAGLISWWVTGKPPSTWF